MFQELEEKEKDHIAVKQLKIFKQASGKTAKIYISIVGVRPCNFNIKALEDLTLPDT